MILKKRFSASRCFWLSCLTLIGIFALSAGKAGAAPVEEWTLSLNESQLFPGAVARVDLVPAGAVSSAVLLWKGVPIPLVSLSWQGSLTAFFGIPRNELPGSQTVELAVTALDGKILNYSFPLVVLAKDYPVQQLTLPESKVSLDQTSLDRHHREQETLKAALADLRRAPLWQEQFVMPVPGKVLSPFGVQRVLNGKPRNSHSGLDLRAPLGQPVVASAAGEVVLTADHFFSGKSVYINHGMGIVTMYFHLAEISVSPGEMVATGQMIGKAGSTGRSTGPHLHWGVRVHDCMVDPLTLLAVAGTAPGEGVSGVSIRD
jgi:murein DD-endopeptidase MepM/ murein hydrolase activator NlpD